MRLLILACSGSPEPTTPSAPEVVISGLVTPVEVEVSDGMARIPAGTVKLGPEAPPPGLGGGKPGQMGPAGPPPGQGGKGGKMQPPRPGEPGRHPDLGAPIQEGGPRPFDVEPAQWSSTGGQNIEPRDVAVASFRMDVTEVTRADYREFLEATGYRPPHVEEEWAEDGWNWIGNDPPEGTEDHPVVLASWYDASEYCAWKGKRLPTEAEWQLAALGPKESVSTFPWGSEYDGARMNHGKAEEPNFDDSDGYLTTSPVGSFPAGASRYGLEDVFGNAWEFTSEFRVDSWEFSPLGPGLYVAVRGGSYFFDSETHPAGERNHFLAELRRKTSGFRCAQSP